MRRDWVNVDGLRVAYRSAGRGEPVVLLHGWPTSSYLWRHAMPAIADAGRHAIAPDLIGFGASTKPADAAYTLDFHATLLDRFLTVLGVERTALVAHDLGGPVGLLWAVRHPERLERLVLLDTLLHPRRLILLRTLLGALRLPGIGRMAVHPAGIRLLLRLGSVRRGGITPDARAEYTHPSAHREHRRTVLRTLLAPRFEEFDEITSGLDRLAQTDLLIAWADRDLLLPRAEMRRIHARLPHARTATIAGAGHFLTEDQPDRVAAVVAAHLAPIRREVA